MIGHKKHGLKVNKKQEKSNRGELQRKSKVKFGEP